MRAITDVQSENQFQKELEQYFENHGWIALREVSPHSSNNRADLIVQHDDFGWFGIETKFFDNDGGAKVADAHHQIITKYRGKKYVGNRIDLWCVAPYFSGYDTDDEWVSNRAQWRRRFTREFFCKHGVGILDISRRPLIMDFAYSMACKKVPVDSDKETRHHQNVDVQRIEKSVSKKMEKYAYQHARKPG